ncbi:phosphotransferase domain-containing protein, partial [mine drainage metagenome]
DTDILDWRGEADRLTEQTRATLRQQAVDLSAAIGTLEADVRLAQWRTRIQAAKQAHDELQGQLAAQGVSDPQAFARLTKERQQLETQLKELRLLQASCETLAQQIEAQRTLILEKWQAITQARQAFIQDTLANNNFVRITVVPFGFDARQIERELRELVEATDERFADD